jgi:glycosyltransferase involved in cell wall biosynthesis
LDLINVKKINNIGIFHYQTGNTDGVSLEIDKWRRVLEKMGYSVHICSGDLGMGDGTRIPELYHHKDEIKTINRNAFSAMKEFDADGLMTAIEEISNRLEDSICGFLKSRQIDLLIVNNIWSVGLNLPVALAIERARKKFGLPAIGHHHDFYWERRDGLSPTCPPVEELLRDYFPPKDPLIKHVVINSLAKQDLVERKGMDATIIPNVFDFSAPIWSVDSYNSDLRSQAGINESDILILQATRVIPRKGIELSIDFVKILNSLEMRSKLSQSGLFDGRPFTNQSRIILVLTGYTKDDVSGNYLNFLKQKAHKENVTLLHIEDLISHSRSIQENQKMYSFWDTYAVADLVTYPSLWEGWGNQLLEAFQARLPVVLFEYPVYLEDIKQRGFDVISLGSTIDDFDEANLARINQETLINAANEAVRILTDRDRRLEMVNHNHLISQKHYSLTALQTMLKELLET